MRKNVFFNRDENVISGGNRYERFFRNSIEWTGKQLQSSVLAL